MSSTKSHSRERDRPKNDVVEDIIRPQTNAHEKKFLCLDNNLIKKVFGYKKIFSNDQMIENTVKVYEAIYKKDEILPIIENIINGLTSRLRDFVEFAHT